MNDTKTLTKMLDSAYANLENNRILINSLNVFPIPDGDTGDNMSATFKCGIDKIHQKEYQSGKELVADFALACLMGARGNSGVILSLAAKGFSHACESEKNAAACLVKGLRNATDLCYESVASPVEGTALTVLRACADKAEKLSAHSDTKKLFAAVCDTAELTLAKTKELLDELKHADVVDAGAKGIVCLLEGMRLVVEKNKMYELSDFNSRADSRNIRNIETKNKYCCECVIKSNGEISFDEIKKSGDSVITAETDGIVKIHVHSNDPVGILNIALTKGELINAKIENMLFQHNSITKGEKKKYAFVAASQGVGISECLEQLGCDEIITTDKRVPTGDVMKAISRVNAETVFLLPNDKNNFLSFRQAMKMSDKGCIMLESEDSAQGLGMLMSFDEELDKNENRENMLNSLSSVKTAKVCVADKEFKGIRKGEGIGIANGKIFVKADNTLSCLEKAVEKLFSKAYNVISVFCSKDTDNKTLEKLKARLSLKYKETQINVINGGQSVYDYIIMIS